MFNGYQEINPVTGESSYAPPVSSFDTSAVSQAPAAPLPGFGAGAESLMTSFEASTMMNGAMGGFDQGAAFQSPVQSMIGDYNSIMQAAMPLMVANMNMMMQYLQMMCNNNGLNNNGLNNNNLNINNNGVDNNNGVVDNNNADGNKVNLAPSGGWGGTQTPVQNLVALAGEGFNVVSAKRDRQYTTSGNVSDHYAGNKNAYANDIGWGSSKPTQASDEAASRIVAALGGPANWGEKGGVFNTTINGIRYQLIYKSMVGGNHYNHIHLGAKRA